jgi:hypothetical protein
VAKKSAVKPKPRGPKPASDAWLKKAVKDEELLDGFGGPLATSKRLDWESWPHGLQGSAEQFILKADREVLGRSSEAFGVTLGLAPGVENLAPSQAFGPVSLMAYLKANLASRIDMSTIQQNCPDAKGKSVDRILQGWYGEDVVWGIESCAKIFRANPGTKRAVITLGRRFLEPDRDASEWKCMRELVFTLRDGKLNCHAFARAQALEVLPKNLYVNTSIQQALARKIGAEPGWYLHTMALLFRGGQDKQ